jgi:hypothetical protein
MGARRGRSGQSCPRPCRTRALPGFVQGPQLLFRDPAFGKLLLQQCRQ